MFLDNKKPRPFFGGNAVKMLCYGIVEITVLGSSGRGIGSQVFPELCNTDWHARISVDGRLVSQEAFFKSYLCLGSEVVVHASKHNDDFVTRVGGLADQARVVAGLTRLNVAYHKAPTIPRIYPSRIFQ